MEKEKVIERVKQIKARLLNYPMDAIADIHFILETSFNLMEEMEKEVEENKRLQARLDREIKINRKMKRALEKYATMELEDGVCYDSFTGETFRDGIYDLETGEPPQRLAQQVLKEIDNKE